MPNPADVDERNRLPPRTYLYVPGDDRAKLDKAMGLGADALIVDLEDAIAPNRRDAAMRTLSEWSDSVRGTQVLSTPEVWVRIHTGDLLEPDLEVVSGLGIAAGVVLAKTDSANDVGVAASHLKALGSSRLRIAPLLESATAISNSLSIANHPRTSLLHLGELDLAADLNLSPSTDESELAFYRASVVMAARVAGLPPPVGPVSVEIRNSERFRTSTETIARLGFFGRACIHPAQLAIVRNAFKPTAAEVERARAELQFWTHQIKSGAGVIRDQTGRMVDAATIRRARRVVALGDGRG